MVLAGAVTAATGTVTGNLAVGSSTAASYPLDVTGQLRGLYSGSQGVIVMNPNTTNVTSPCEMFFDRTAAASGLNSSFGMSGSTRGAYWWVTGSTSPPPQAA